MQCAYGADQSANGFNSADESASGRGSANLSADLSAGGCGPDFGACANRYWRCVDGQKQQRPAELLRTCSGR